MDKLQVLSKLKEEKLVAVVRAESKKKEEKIIDAIVKGGINFIEITMTVPGAIDVIKEFACIPTPTFRACVSSARLNFK